ncbi:nucleotidyltransferase domain-containing protein [candidate division KSB1 bacterium]|nr:nucleotidyltransferase domain-containing protein [candidate division KSB1 bacterium]
MNANDLKKARQFLAQKEKERKKRLDARFARAKSDFQKIIETIIEKYQPEKIYQWGSLLDRRHFSEISDIDIALEGITSAEIFFKLYGDIMSMTDFCVDIIQLEKIEPEFAELIKEKGKIVYERKRENTHPQK